MDLALGMIHGPELLFMDEPTTGLDPQSRAQFWSYIRKIREQGMTIFLSTHYLDEADALCDRVAIVDQGIIKAEGTPGQLKKQVGGDIITLHLQEGSDEQAVSECILAFRQVAFVHSVQEEKESIRLYVSSEDEVFVQVIRLLDRHQIKTNQVSHARPTLDDVFLHNTGRSLAEDHS